MKSVLAVVASLLVAVSSLKQEIRLYEKPSPDVQGNVFTFQNHTPISPLSLAGIQQVCTDGYFLYYAETGYNSQRMWSGGINSCAPINLAGVKSFRYVGAWDTAEDAVSLYAGASFQGQEILVDRTPYAGITTKIGSLGLTGKSAWTVFEGANFEGKSACIPAPRWAYNLEAYNSLSSFNISTVGSLVKGCCACYTPAKLDQVRKEWRALKVSVQ